MSDFKRIQYHNLRADIRLLPRIVGREEEMARLSRVTNRRLRNNVCVVGPAGAGKTSLVYGWLKILANDSAYDGIQLVQLLANHVQQAYVADDAVARYEEAVAALPPSIVFIDGIVQSVGNDERALACIQRIYTHVLKKPEVRLVLTMEPHEYAWLERAAPALAHSCEVITLKTQPKEEQIQILRSALPRLNTHKLVVPTTALTELAQYVERFPILGTMPRAAISLLDESLAAARAAKKRTLDAAVIQSVVAGRTGVPLSQLHASEIEQVGRLATVLAERVVGQNPATEKIAATLQRAKLGMRNPNKPLGSFLMLGPSGVGKTETAKLVAETLFGRSEAFIRFDMSEFAQEHTVQRLIGSPAGYIGHESGGALTNALKKEPYSLILLDEIEKAHPKVFDIFLQVLDDGRITSGQNETVDARHAVIMATSNIGVSEVLAGIREGASVHSSDFLQQRIMPALAEMFRLEFINRFDSILVFNPLSIDALVRIAELEMKKIEQRLAKHRVEFSIDPAVLRAKIESIADPRFGARPVKRFIEETCESLLVQSLIATPAAKTTTR